jgi:hypothetical protein
MKKTPLIFMQDTINYLYKVDEKKFDRILVELGEMEVCDIIREETIRYYKFKV